MSFYNRTPGGPEARREALAFGLPLFIHTGAAVLLQYSDRFMLERMSTLDELGLYSLAGQIGTAMLIISTSTNQAYLPFLYRQHEADPRLVGRAQRYIILFFAVVGIAGVLITPPVIHTFIDPRYAEAALPAQILLVAGIFHGWYFLALGSLLVRKETKRIAWVTVAAAVLNISLNFYVIPRYHSLGAAWTTLAAEILLCAGMWWAARRAREKTPLQHAADRLAAES
jgi:O-antigen/teichoic acid export membrane protein